jgi:hypothetical protein
LQFNRRHQPCQRVKKIHTSLTTQAIDQGTVNLVAEEGKEYALFAAGLCHGA